MQAKDDILTLLREKSDQIAQEMQRAVILQPGSIGDYILTLPLAQFIKESLALGRIDIIGHTEYIGILPGRTCVDGVRSIDSTDLHMLFGDPSTFDLADNDPLISLFADYAWIVTFLGEPNGNFEKNLIFTANCSHSAEVITLSTKPKKDLSGHITEYYIQQFIDQSGLSLQYPQLQLDNTLIKSTKEDKKRAKELLKETGIEHNKKVIVIQPGSGGTKKCWHLGNFLAVAKKLRSRNIEAIFLLGPAELERFGKTTMNDINNVAQSLTDLSLTDVLGLLSCVDGFIGNDSGITHLAAGLGTTTLAIFGPTNPNIYRPIGPAVTVFTNDSATFAEKISTTLQQQLLKTLLA